MGLADIVEKYCRKGERLFVEGSIEYGQYKDKEGQTRYTTEIKVRKTPCCSAAKAAAATSIRTPTPARTLRPAARVGQMSPTRAASTIVLRSTQKTQDDDLPF